MPSRGNGRPNGFHEASGQAAPGWLLVLPWSVQPPGGVNHVVRSLIRCLREGGVFSPLLITPRDSKGDSEPVPEAIKQIALDIAGPLDGRYPLRALLSFICRLPFRCQELRSIVNRYNIKIINPHFPDLSSLTFLALKRFCQFDGKIVLSFHNSDVRDALCTTGLERHLWGILLRHADRIVVVSNSLGTELLTLEPRVADKLTTIYNGVDLGMFASPNRDQGPLPPAQTGPTIMSVGVFSTRKGHDVLVQAFSLVVKDVPNVRLIIVGQDGPEFKRTRQLIDTLSLGERVFMYKDVPHKRIPAFLAQAQLFVLASRREGHPLAAIEAGAAGLPVICTRSAGTSELISDGVTGRLVDVDDEHALAEAMIDLLTHPEKAQRIATSFRDYIRNNLTWKNTYEKYLQLAGDGASHNALIAESAKWEVDT